MNVKMPDALEYWTSDTVAECVSYQQALTEEEGDALYAKLWSFLADAENPTPLGGDGTAGTVETPDGRLDPDNDDKAPHWWSRLTEREQRAIATSPEMQE